MGLGLGPARFAFFVIMLLIVGPWFGALKFRCLGFLGFEVLALYFWALTLGC